MWPMRQRNRDEEQSVRSLRPRARVCSAAFGIGTEIQPIEISFSANSVGIPCLTSADYNPASFWIAFLFSKQ
jgi:hypothetical protein